MTYHELYEQLLAKGYTPRPCGDHIEGIFCCATAIYENWEEFKEDPASAEEMLANFLTLDRREVFKVRYGEGPSERGHHTMKLWEEQLMEANTAYVFGKVESEIDFLRQHP